MDFELTFLLPTNRDLFPPTARPQKQRPARPRTAFVGENTICSVVFPLKNALESSDEWFFACGEGDNICRKAARAEKGGVMTENGCFGAKKGRVGRVNFNLYHYAGNNPVKYTDPDGREDEDIDWKKEITECINSSSVGFRDELNINLPGFLCLNAYLDLMSTNTDAEINDGPIYSQGVGCSLALQIGDFTLLNFSLDYSRQGKYADGYNCPLALFSKDFEFSHELDALTTYDLTLPIPFLSISINCNEVEDLYSKGCYSLDKFLSREFKELFSKEK